MVEVETLIFPSRTNTSPTNDYYCLGPTPIQVNQCQLDSSEKVVSSKFQSVDKLFSKTESNPIVPETVTPVQFQTVNLDVSYNPVSPVLFVPLHGLPQKKGLSPGQSVNKIKHVKDVCCVNSCRFVPPVPNVPNAVIEQSVGGRLHNFWQVWQKMGANPRVVSVLREGYTLPFKQRPRLTRFPLVQSGYANPVRNRFLKEALANLINKLVVENVVLKSSLAFYNRLFLVPKPNKKWRPILNLSQLNLYLSTNTFKMETPESIRLSLQKGEWVTSLDFSDAYFHIPINQRSRKYLRFFLFNQTFQFTFLPFGLATAPLEFTKVVKEVKLMAQAKGSRIHQYLDDWFLRAPCPETCLHHTRTLLALCQQLGWVVNTKKSELTPQQVFNFVGYRFDLVSGRVLPTQDRWVALQEKLNFIKSRRPNGLSPNRCSISCVPAGTNLR